MVSRIKSSKNYPYILQVNTSDDGGGAEKIVWHLHRSYTNRGYPAYLAVGRKESAGSKILALNSDTYRSSWARFWIGMGNLFSPFTAKVRGIGRIRNFLAYPIGQPRRWLKILRGHEDFDYPAAWRLLGILPNSPNIIHCHNLHGGYFVISRFFYVSK